VFSKRELTPDGIEKTFALNHLAPFLLTNLLLDLVTAAAQGRIVAVSSEVHAGKLDWDNLQSEKSHQFFKAYQATKTENILFTTNSPADCGPPQSPPTQSVRDPAAPGSATTSPEPGLHSRKS
jgi:NAD(P)-dependent dehydrogenase (short-subunit alcohol dehydrogenase family)